MGFILPAGVHAANAKSPYCEPGTPTVLVNPASIVIPSGVMPGDDVFVLICSQTALVGTPTGYTRIGAENHWTTAINTAANYVSLWRHTWAFGDPTTLTFTNTSGGIGYVCFIVRSDTGSGPYTIQTDVTTIQAGGAGATTAAYGPFSPASSLSDVRILFIVSTNPTGLSVALPAVTPSDANPTGNQLGQMDNFGFSTATALFGLCRAGTQQTDADSAAQNLTITAGAQMFTRAITLTDGSGHSPNMSDNLDFAKLDPPITADGLAGDLGTGLDAAKGKFVGGARIL